MKILLLNDGQKFNNWGIQSTTICLKNILREYVDVNAEFSYLPHEIFMKKYRFDPSLFGKKIFNRNSRLRKYLGIPIKFPNYADEFEQLYDYWVNKKLNKIENQVYNKIIDADLIVFNAEGSVYRANKSAALGLFLLALASKLGKKTLFCNGSFSLTNQDNILESYAKKAMEEIDHVFIREPVSFKTFCKHINHSDVEMVPDAVFIDNKTKNIEPLKQQFILSSSMLPLHSYRFAPHPIETLASEIKSKFGLDPIIAAIDTEDKYLQNIAKKNNWKLLGGSCSPLDVRNEIAKSQFILSGRYHHLIYGLIDGTPIIPFDTTSQKIKGLLELINSKQTLFDPLNILQEKPMLINDVGRVLKNRSVISNEYNLKLIEIQKSFKKYSKIG
jgi:polysaccharide pyruvyl transferase WcaK-like protein